MRRRANPQRSSAHRGLAVVGCLALLVSLLAAGAPTLAADHAADRVAPPAADHSADQVAGHGGGHHEEHGLGTRLPLWSAIPFAGILLSIALGPLVAPHWWHKNFPKASAFWALAFAIPFLLAYGSEAVQSILHIYLIDYIPFIILLWALFTAAGGIYVGGRMAGTPKVNLILLAIGTLIASWIGTTGAAMVMIRPVLRANGWRRYKVHTIVFFIFLVANIGGSLTPLGDPPLFLGFIHGVPFFWVTTHLFLHAVLAVVILLGVYFALDTYFYRREEKAGREPEADPGVEPNGTGGIRVEGLHNLLFLLGIMGGVIFSGSVQLGEIPVYGHVTVQIQNVLKDAWLVLMGLLSLWLTDRAIRKKNGFSWFPIQEVGYLFAGIFMTIIPALAILQAGENGSLAWLVNGVTEPVHYFWITGTLSSFLDNAPTYLTFFNSALGKLHITEPQVFDALRGVTSAMPAAALSSFLEFLTAISVGAVFFGAVTYIGNAPNFMVKSIAEEAGIPMPSFFGYILKYSLPILVPVFVIVTLIFFM